MKWYGASQKKGTLNLLETSGKGKEVRPVTLYTHTFVLLGDGRADERDLLHYTASASTPQEAEGLAFAAYQTALGCAHRMLRKAPTLEECAACGVQRRVPLASSGAGGRKSKAERRFLGLF
ncbi:hypothetical protein SAMN04488058_1376 [Deinococcus reticulitermitis]|uniref:Uncharacterized protein n=1 Tax=Deinococcus reticulitermitis TaxID=856736 RepID=A0A1H7CZC5_9DEIO|nr:hypothetical protein [Deinococcus reticulitermitis]SEJ92110.1 hypothetical protein SAMN04488058_1376 [Deinococcus reticulitermitis]